MMENVIVINWRADMFRKCHSNGAAEIYLDYAFPSSVAQMKRLIKLVQCGYDYEEVTANFESMRAYIQHRIPEMEAIFKTQCEAYMPEWQHKADLQQLVKSKKHPNGVPLTKGEWNKAKNDLEHSKQLVREAKKIGLSYKRNIERIKANLELIEQIQTERR